MKLGGEGVSTKLWGLRKSGDLLLSLPSSDKNARAKLFVARHAPLCSCLPFNELLALLRRNSQAQKLSAPHRCVIDRHRGPDLHLSSHLRILVHQELHALPIAGIYRERVSLIPNVCNFPRDGLRLLLRRLLRRRLLSRWLLSGLLPGRILPALQHSRGSREQQAAQRRADQNLANHETLPLPSGFAGQAFSCTIVSILARESPVSRYARLNALLRFRRDPPLLRAVLLPRHIFLPVGRFFPKLFASKFLRLHPSPDSAFFHSRQTKRARQTPQGPARALIC